MKIKTVIKSVEEVLAAPRAMHKKPRRPDFILRSLAYVIGKKELKETEFSFTVDDGARALMDAGTPCLVLMNHSSFIDLSIVSKIFYPHPYNIVCTMDALVGKEWLMRRLGCIPTKKFVSDVTLIRDMKYALTTLKSNVLMFPEAGYSFDGCATAIQKGLGHLLQLLDVPVLMIHADGAFSRDPLYNNLQKRQVKVTAAVTCFMKAGEAKAHTVEELDAALAKAFSFDNFRWQAEHGVQINEPFRAEGLERILYRCSSCGAENRMYSTGTRVVCMACGKMHTLDPFGRLSASDGKETFRFVSDWYAWERECVRRELAAGTYKWEDGVDIGIMKDYKALYSVGEGKLVHTANGFELRGCDGKITYKQSPRTSYTLNADYFWYEKGDIVCIGNNDLLYYCFPKTGRAVAKARLAVEELYKLYMKDRRPAGAKA